MKVIVYRLDNVTLSRQCDEPFDISGVGTCYLFSKSEDNNVLKDFIQLYHDRDDTIFLIPEILKSPFAESLGGINNKNHTPLLWKQYDDNDLGGMETTGIIKNKIIEYVKTDNPSPDQIEFVETLGGNSNFLDKKMKIVIYKADKDVPFATDYDQLGSTDNIIFSNRQDKVTDFNSKSVDELKHLVQPWLPKRVGSEADNTIFYVPYDMWNKFIDILERLINGFKEMMVKGEKTSVPTSQQLGLGKGSSLASFYDEMEIQKVLEEPTEKNMIEAVKELEELLNEIVTSSNEVDAIFVYDLTNNLVLYNSTASTEREEDLPKFLTERKNYGASVANFGDLRNVSTVLNTFGDDTKRGKLQRTMFQLTNGVLNVYFFDEYTVPIAVVFVSAKPTGLGSLVLEGTKRIDTIIEKLRPLL